MFRHILFGGEHFFRPWRNLSLSRARLAAFQTQRQTELAKGCADPNLLIPTHWSKTKRTYTGLSLRAMIQCGSAASSHELGLSELAGT